MQVFVTETGDKCRQVETKCILNTMNLDHSTSGDILFSEKGLNLFALVSLELDDLAKFLVIDDAAVATELLLEGLCELCEIELVIQTLDGGERLASVALLQTDVDDAFRYDSIIAVGIGERVKRSRDPGKGGIVGH